MYVYFFNYMALYSVELKWSTIYETIEHIEDEIKNGAMIYFACGDGKDC